MLFSKIPADELILKYPDLEILNEECPGCFRKRTVNVPFINKKWIVLTSESCPCGCPPIVCQIPKDKNTLKWTEDLYNKLISK